RSAPGLAVTSAAAGVEDFGYGIDPHHGIARAARFGLGFARVLAFLRRRRDGCWRCKRHTPALGHEYPFGLAACLNGRLVGAPVIVALPGGPLLRDRGLRQCQQSYQCRTHSEGRFHHTCLRENSADAHGLAASIGEKETAALAAAMWSAAPDRQRAIVRSLFFTMLRTKREQGWQEKTAAPRGAAAGSIVGRLLPPSMRGERRGIRLPRRLGGDRGFGRFGLLLVPFDRLGLARERAREHLVHARDRDDVEAFLDAVADLDQILGVLLRDQHRLHAAPPGGGQLLPEAPPRPHP